jgi:GAF domain-containing protein
MSRGDSTAAFLSALAADLLAVGDESRTVEAIVTRAVESVADAEVAGLTVRAASRRRSRHVTLGWTDPTVGQADGLQHDAGEGPVVDPPGEGGWVRSGDVGADPRWPVWGPQVAELGLRSLLSVQLVSAGEPLGALTLYARRRGCFVDPETVDLALLFASHAANALASARRLAGLETAMSSRHVIGMAQGILMERYRLDEQQAFAYLSRLSSHQNRKLRDLAQDLVATRTVPEPGLLDAERPG